jgi:hypothetical protein
VKGLLRFFLGVALLPACWGAARVLIDALLIATGREGGFSVEAVSLLAGMVSFILAWCALPHPVRTYVLGHELTHALWGLAFGARASDLRIGENGGSVRLTKTNLLITLAPYFFPFYTFVVIIAALITFAFLRPLPYLPLWMFAIGFTWAFHVLFTLETLAERQPDVTAYGRLFSWTFIFCANILLVAAWLAAATPLGFGGMWRAFSSRVCESYAFVWSAAASLRG